MIGRIPETATQALEWWDAGEPVMTVEMGGLGPSYEQCIHITVFELFRRFADSVDTMKDPKVLEGAVREISIGKELHLSGAQADAAMALAYSCLKDGYKKTIDDITVTDRDRRIQVLKHFPQG